MKRIRGVMWNGKGAHASSVFHGTHIHERERSRIIPWVLGVLCISLVLSGALSVLSDDSSAAICDNVNVYIEVERGEYEKVTVSGASTVKGAIESALTKMDMTWEYNTNNENFKSVDGRVLGEGRYWRIHQWLPLGTAGWGIMGYDSKSDGFMQSGCSYCLHESTLSSADGTNVYSVPDFQPESTGYVFIRFANGFDPDNDFVKDTFTAEIREEGFWLEGRGSSMGEVLKNAVESQGLQIELKTGMDGNGNDLQCWIISMFGIGDVYLDNNVWSYWSQWTWVNHEWYYNDWTLGYYDPAVYKYVECIYLISTPDPYGDGYIIDKGGLEPNPDVDPINCISNYNTVVFKSGDDILSTQEVRYGRQADTSKVPIPEAPPGKFFLGWGDVTKPITGYTEFIAQFGESEHFTVRYYDESRIVLLHTEKVKYGSSATYNAIPTKPETAEYTYVFKGWSSDLSFITSDVEVTPVFEAVKKKDDHIHEWGSGVVTKKAACTEPGVRTFTCSCGDTRTEPVSATGHDWDGWTVVKEATVNEAGLEERACSDCSYKEQRSIPKLEVHVHSWGVGTVTTEATCTEPGVRTFTCSCGDEKTEAIPIEGHSWGGWIVDREPTPSTNGLKHRECSGCNDVVQSDIIYKGSETINIQGDSSTTIASPQGGSWNVESKLTADVVGSGDSVSATIGSDSILEAIGQLTTIDDGVSDISVTVSVNVDTKDAVNTSLVISPEDIDALSEVGDYTMRYSTGLFTMDMNSQILSNVGDNGVSLSFRSDVQGVVDRFSNISNGHAIDITMTSGDAPVHVLGGNVSVSIPYVLPAGVGAEEIVVWYVDGSSLREVDATYDVSTGSVSFTTDHFSQWIVGVEDSGSNGSSNDSDMMIYMIVGIIAGIVVVIVLVKRK